MYSQDQKYFHFRLVLALTFMLYITASTKALSVPQGCVEVAIYGKNWMIDSDDVNSLVQFDTKFLNNFVHCVWDVYKLHAETNWDWKSIQKIIPPEVHDLIRAVPKMTKTTLPLAGKAGLTFVSAYLSYKTMELYDRAITLKLDQELHRKEFEILRSKKLQPIMDLIDREIVSLLDSLDSATLKKISQRPFEELNRHNTELRSLLRVIYKDYKAAESGKTWSVVSGVSSTALCAGSLALGFPAPLIPAVTGVVFSMMGYLSFSNTAQHLQTLLEDVETICNEIEEYRTLLENSCSSFALQVVGILLCVVFILGQQPQRNFELYRYLQLVQGEFQNSLHQRFSNIYYLWAKKN